MFASQEILSLDELYKAYNELTTIKQTLEREALFGEGHLSQDKVEIRERAHNSIYYQLSKAAPMIKVYDFIGKPHWVSASLLSDRKITQEVDRLLLVMAQHGIEIKVSEPHANADDRQLYTFITEVVFPKEIRDIRLPGICYSIDYNYYKPDPVYTCIFITDMLLDGLFRENYDYLDGCLAEHFFINNDPREELYSRVVDKLDAYHQYLNGCFLIDWSIEDIELDAHQSKGIVHLLLHYGLEKHQKPSFTDRGRLVCYKNDEKWWFIYQIDFPGLCLD
ncbi:hypothetical protein GCM10027347_15410 [Larkinella harenae]